MQEKKFEVQGFGFDTLEPIKVYFGHWEGDKNYCDSQRTVRARQRIGSEAVPELVRALHDEDPNVRADAAHLLGSIDKNAASLTIPDLIAASKNDQDQAVRLCAVSALMSIAGIDLNVSTNEVKAVIPAVIAALKDSVKDVRLAATYAFQSMGFSCDGNDSKFNGKLIPELKAAIPVLIETLKDEDKQIRSNANRALENMSFDATSLVPVLIQALKDEDEKIRSSVAHVLGTIGVRGGIDEQAALAVSALIEVLKQEKDVQVRLSAISALGRIGERHIREQAATVVPALIEALKNDYEQVRSKVTSALSSALGATDALARIAETWQDNASKLSNQDLDFAIFYLETALKTLENPHSEFVFVTKGKKCLRRSLNFLVLVRGNR